jgi:hypothetical protein
MSDSKKAILISIKSLRELEYSYKDIDEFYPDLKAEGIKTEMELQMRYSWNLDKEAIAIYTKFLIYILKDENRTDVLEYLCVTDFQVVDLKALLIEKEGEEYEIDRGLEESLAKMAIAHGRGMFFQKTCHTRFKGVVYPLINLDKILLSNHPDGLKLKKS